jgi:4-diphosphocytidyl-2-C-methyl-D-erythritol kinase
VIVTSVTVRVPAKINLQLAVGPLRPDGYHGLVTVFHAVSLFDELTVAAADADSVAMTGEGAEVVPANGDNLALRAVRALRAAVAERGRSAAGPDGAIGAPETGRVGGSAGNGAPEVGGVRGNGAFGVGRYLGSGAPEVGGVGGNGAFGVGGTAGVGEADGNGTGATGVSEVAVTIAKRIPVAGGMAGGSADAAAALVACNALWGTGLSQQELCAVAGGVGSDVAFAVLGGTAIGRGRGEQLTPVLPAAPATYHWVLALADGHLSTPTVFRALDRQRQGQEVAEPELSAELMAALSAGDPVGLGAALSNDLQEPALTLFPALRKTLDAGLEAGALGALVSGSGPTCFFLARDDRHATDLAASLSGGGVCRAVATAIGPAAGASVILR